MVGRIWCRSRGTQEKLLTPPKPQEAKDYVVVPISAPDRRGDLRSKRNDLIPITRLNQGFQGPLRSPDCLHEGVSAVAVRLVLLVEPQ